MKVTDKPSSKRIAELEAATAKYITEIARLESKVGELQGEMHRLHAEYEQKSGVKQRAHALYRSLDDAIIARIDRRGYNRKAKPIANADINPEVLQSTDFAVLTAAANDYDISTYFRMRSFKSGMRLRYRILSKAYRIARDMTKGGAKIAYRTARKVAK